MTSMLPIGCVIYGVSSIAFSAAIGIAVVATWLGAWHRSQELGHLSWNEKYHHPITDQERPYRVVALALFAISALILFPLVVFVEIFGIRLGFFAEQTTCRGMWPDPRSLRALNN